MTVWQAGSDMSLGLQIVEIRLERSISRIVDLYHISTSERWLAQCDTEKGDTKDLQNPI
jgi:hypothetical protein